MDLRKDLLKHLMDSMENDEYTENLAQKFGADEVRQGHTELTEKYGDLFLFVHGWVMGELDEAHNQLQHIYKHVKDCPESIRLHVHKVLTANLMTLLAHGEHVLEILAKRDKERNAEEKAAN